MKKDKTINWKRTKVSDLNLKGMKVIIVGGTGGIGRAFSRSFAALGAYVIVVGQTFRDANVRGIEFIKADLSLMTDAERVAKQLPAESADLVIFTTGTMAGPVREETAEGIERDMAVSYLSRLVILREIAPRLGNNRQSAAIKPRVFIMGYPGSGQKGSTEDLNAEKSYGRMKVHMNTVAGNEILVLDAAKKYGNVNFFGLNPGFVSTNIRANLFGGKTLLYRLIEGITGILTASAETYSERIIPLLVSSDIEYYSGALFNSKGSAILPTPDLSDNHVNLFLATSEALVARANVRVKSH